MLDDHLPHHPYIIRIILVAICSALWRRRLGGGFNLDHAVREHERFLASGPELLQADRLAVNPPAFLTTMHNDDS